MRRSSITTNTGRSFFAATVDLTGPLRPPETITAEEMRWDTEEVNERRKMHQWVKLGGYSLFLWWALTPFCCRPRRSSYGSPARSCS